MLKVQPRSGGKKQTRETAQDPSGPKATTRANVEAREASKNSEESTHQATSGEAKTKGKYPQDGDIHPPGKKEETSCVTAFSFANSLQKMAQGPTRQGSKNNSGG